MGLFYPLAYATGFTPWERAGEAERTRLNKLLAREEAERGGPGNALDLGCGSGTYTAALAARGWTVTGVDLIPRAVAQAHDRIEKLRLSASIVCADVTRLRPDQVGGRPDFFLDVGCYDRPQPLPTTANGTRHHRPGRSRVGGHEKMPTGGHESAH